MVNGICCCCCWSFTQVAESQPPLSPEKESTTSPPPPSSPGATPPFLSYEVPSPREDFPPQPPPPSTTRSLGPEPHPPLLYTTGDSLATMQAAEETKDTVVSSIAPNLARKEGVEERDVPGRNRVADAPGPSVLLQCSVSVCGERGGLSLETQLHVRTEPKPTDMPVVWVARGKKEVVISQPASAFGCIGRGGCCARVGFGRGGHGME